MPDSSSDPSTNPHEPSPLRLAWVGFAHSVKGLLTPQPNDRPLDQFIPLRNKAVEIVLGDRFLHELDGGWVSLTNNQQLEAGEALLLERTGVTRIRSACSGQGQQYTKAGDDS